LKHLVNGRWENAEDYCDNYLRRNEGNFGRNVHKCSNTGYIISSEIYASSQIKCKFFVQNWTLIKLHLGTDQICHDHSASMNRR
jgi:hypothetical protein